MFEQHCECCLCLRGTVSPLSQNATSVAAMGRSAIILLVHTSSQCCGDRVLEVLPVVQSVTVLWAKVPLYSWSRIPHILPLVQGATLLLVHRATVTGPACHRAPYLGGTTLRQTFKSQELFAVFEVVAHEVDLLECWHLLIYQNYLSRCIHI